LPLNAGATIYKPPAPPEPPLVCEALTPGIADRASLATDSVLVFAGRAEGSRPPSSVHDLFGRPPTSTKPRRRALLARHPDQLTAGRAPQSHQHPYHRSPFVIGEILPLFTASEGGDNCPEHGSSHPARPIPPIGELLDALTCTSSPQWNAARCRHTTSAATRLFFSDNIADINQAKRICAACPVAAPCLQGALDRHEPCGVWGGYLLANGQILARKRPRGRPPSAGPSSARATSTA
jgi:hypothetical protein